MFPLPDKKILRKMGYLRDQKGILNRYFRERENWEEHLVNTRNFILASLENKKPQIIRILGSGWLLDFPFEKVYRRCKNIELYDVNHPPQLAHKLKHFPEVKLIRADISGGLISEVYNRVRTGRTINELNVPVLHHDHEDVFYVSLNILNQLDILLVDYIRKYYAPLEQELIEFRKNIQQAHIDFLSRGEFCLISDFSEILINREGEEKAGRQLVYGEVKDFCRESSWKWHFDSTFTYYSQYKTIFEVKAFSC